MRFIAFILALFISCPAFAQVPMTGAGKGAPGGGVTPPTYTPGAQVTPQHPAFSGSSSTFNNVNGGVNFPSGAVVEVFIGNDQGVTFTSVTIGGVSASPVSGAADSSGKCQLYQATMPAAETDQIILSYTAFTVNAIGITSGYFQNLISSTATASSNEAYPGGLDPQVPSASITVPASGFGLAFVFTLQATVPTALSWLTTTPSFITSGGGDIYAPFTANTIFAVGSGHTSTAGAGWLPKVSGVTTSMNFVACMSAAAWN